MSQGFLTGIVLLVVGIITLKFADKLNQIMTFTFVQNKMGLSGTQGYQLIGIILAFLSVFFIFGIIGSAPVDTSTNTNTTQSQNIFTPAPAPKQSPIQIAP